MFAGPVGDSLGRKMTILIGSVIFLLGGGLQTGASSINHMYSGRCLAGVGYVCPAAHPEERMIPLPASGQIN
jgi:MFS family permease